MGKGFERGNRHATLTGAELHERQRRASPPCEPDKGDVDLQRQQKRGAAQLETMGRRDTLVHDDDDVPGGFDFREMVAGLPLFAVVPVEVAALIGDDQGDSARRLKRVVAAEREGTCGERQPGHGELGLRLGKKEETMCILCICK
uniref:DUF834 domain-containing protein n=1 Tax=Oryza meridionalis TaxID=40149 RepID=A0A0E0D8S5_9ORYZ